MIENNYAPVILISTIVLVIIFYLRFEKKKSSIMEIVLLAIMIVMAVTGRFIFAALPHFKPVSAIIIIYGIYMGAESAFMCGSLTALISNFMFGQGPFTPFQMAAWGLVGAFAGIFGKYLKKSRILLCIYGGIAGVLYSVIVDVWSVLWIDGVFNIKRYLALLVTSLPVMATYMISNVVFLMILAGPLGKKLKRIDKKYIKCEL